MNTPSVTVVIPVRERPALVVDAIGSALAQTISVDEVVVVDDASTDDTPDVIAAIDDPRVRLIRRDHPGGGSASRNTGIQAANGSVIGFLDSDDVWHPRRLERGLRHLASSNVGLSCCSFLATNDGKNTTGVPGVVRRPGRGKLLALRGGPLSASIFFVRRAVVDEGIRFDERLPALQDLDFAISVERAGFAVGGVNDILVLKRRSDSREHIFNPESEFAARVLLVEKYGSLLASNASALRAHRRALALARVRLGKSDASEWTRLLADALAPLRLPDSVGRWIGPGLASRFVWALSHLADPRPEDLVDRLRDRLHPRSGFAFAADERRS